MVTPLKTPGYRETRRSKTELVIGRIRYRFTRTVPVVKENLRDHGLSLAAMFCFSAAGFIHSVFTGLIVTGALLVLFELKIGD